MDIHIMHQKLADDEVLRNADQFHTAIVDALHTYTWVVESVEDCHDNLDAYNEKAAELLKEVHQRFENGDGGSHRQGGQNRRPRCRGSTLRSTGQEARVHSWRVRGR